MLRPTGGQAARSTRFAIAAACACAAAAAPLVLPGSAGAASADSGLGLPALSSAHRYIVAPSSRTVKPVRVEVGPSIDDDFVSAGSSLSEQAHQLVTGTSSSGSIDGLTMREAGSGDGGSFGYTLHVPAGREITIRVEEAGSSSSDYWVLADGHRVYHRTASEAQAGTWDGLAGVVHYQFKVPVSLIGAAHGKSATKLRITFRNSDDPGSGAQIASVWALSSAGHPQPPYGGSVSNAAKATTATGMTLSSHIFGRPYAIFDFGHEVGGRVQATLKNSGPAMTVGLAFSEAPIYMTTASDFSEDSPGVATETHYITVPHGTTTFEDPVIRGGFRYLMVFADSPGTVHVSKLRVHFTASPDAKNLRSYKGAFLSSNSALNKLWYEAAYTLQMDTINPNTGRSYPAAPGEVQNNAKIAQGTTAIVDGAKRDRMDWVGDQSVEDPVAYMTTDDTRSVYNSFAFMGKGAAADGQVPGIFLPGSGYNDGWGEYAAWWVQEFWNYYLYTGSTSFLTQWFPTVEKDMAWFQSQVDSNGLVNTGSGGTWGYGLNGEQTYLNTLYVLILGDAASAATAQGDTALATQYQTEASSVTSAINSKLWDSTTGAYIAAPGNTAHPQDANVMAVLSGVAAQGGNESSVFSFLRTQWTPYGPLDIDQPNSFVNQYVSPFVTYYELLAYAGQNSQTTTDQAMDLLDRTWSPMEKAGYPGTMWENVSLSGDPQLGAYTSLSHGWSAGVVPFLTNELLGVNPTAGGFSQFTVLPHPPQGMSWAKGAIPTPHGPISTSWKQTDSGNDLAVFVKAPKGTTYSVGVPDSASTVKANGTVIWSGGVAQISGVADVNGYITLSNATGDTTIEGSGN